MLIAERRAHTRRPADRPPGRPRMALDPSKDGRNALIVLMRDVQRKPIKSIARGVKLSERMVMYILANEPRVTVGPAMASAS